MVYFAKNNLQDTKRKFKKKLHVFCNYWKKISNKNYTKTSYQIQFVWYFHFQILVLKQTTKYIFIFKNGI